MATAMKGRAMQCTHNPSLHDRNEGYHHCMWCEETGNCDGGTEQCAPHRLTWIHSDEIKKAMGIGMSCKHDPSKRDQEEGYEHCMWCENTGDCDGDTGVCTFHEPTWAQHEDIANPVDIDAGW